MHQILTHIFLLRILYVHAYSIEVDVEEGSIVGQRSVTEFDQKPFYAFYEVPYAKPPIGKRRFKVPVAPKWRMGDWRLDGSRDNYAACAQPHIVHTYSIFGVEDCLYLNIFTPRNPKVAVNAKADLAVIVFYHGFGFFSSISHLYGPDFLMENNVIVVTATYRHGVFGFLGVNSTEVHKNTGLKDITMSLQWIKKNIKQFGGDVNKITAMGSGSAATLLSLLLVTKKRNLFTRMILHSGSPFSPAILQDDVYKESDNFMKELAKLQQDDILKAKAPDIIKAANKVYKRNHLLSTQFPIIPFTPILEDKSDKRPLLTKTPNDFYKEGLHEGIEIPILVGFNTRESITDAVPFLVKPQLLKDFDKARKFHVPFTQGCKYKTYSKTYEDIFNTIKQQYFDENITIENILHYTTDLHKYPVYKFIKSHMSSKSKMYVYKFNYQGKLNAVKQNALGTFNVKIKGAAHGDELCYLFKCKPMYDTYRALEKDDRDRAFIKEMAEMWTNFAKSGNPNLKSFTDSTEWRPMTEKDDAIMLISRSNKMGTSKVEEKMFKFWNDLYEKFYSERQCNRLKDEL